MRRWQRTILVVVAVESLFLASAAVFLMVVTEHEPYDRLPVLIDGDANFTSENGVTGGIGTLEDPYVIEGWTIDGSLANGVDIRNTEAHFIVRGVTVINLVPPGFGRGSGWYPPINGGCGVLLYNTSNGAVESCTLTDNEYGIFVEGSSDAVLRENNVSETAGNNVRCGVTISHSLRVRIEGNTFQNNGIVFDGTSLQHFNSHDVAASNTVGGRPVEYVKDSSNWDLGEQEAGQIIVVNCSSFTLSDTSVEYTDIGILAAFCQDFAISGVEVEKCCKTNVLIWNCSDATVSECSVSESIDDSGIHVRGSQDIRIEDCRLRDNRWINLNVEGCEDVSVSRCWASSQYGLGIYLRNSRNVTSCMNNVSTPMSAILLVNCNDSRVVENMVSSASTGLSLSYSSCNTTITSNTFYSCALGINVREDVTNVSVVGNNFVNNTEDVQNAPGTSVRWNGTYTEGGNFWSGLDGVDLLSGEDQDAEGGDGLADAPYEPLENVTDWYPLMAPAGWHQTRPIAHVTLDCDIIVPNMYFRIYARTSWDFSDSTDDLQVRWDWVSDGSWDTGWSDANATFEHVLHAGDDGLALVQVMDSDGYVGESLVQLPFDDERPRISLMLDTELDDPTGDDPEASVVIQYWVTDRMGLREDSYSIGQDAVQVMVDGRDISNGGFSYSSVTVGTSDEQSCHLTLYGLSTGRHEVKIVCWDRAGNIAETEASFVVPYGLLETTGGTILVVGAVAAAIGAVTATVAALTGKPRPQGMPPLPENEEAPPEDPA